MTTTTKLGTFAAGVALAIAALGTLLPARGALAQETTPRTATVAPYGDAAGLPGWLRHSIVVCAAETMGLDVDQVLLGLRNGASLAEIGIRAGVHPAALEDGILRCERNLLARMVETGELRPAEARRIFNLLNDHITRIINASWDGAA